MPANAEAIFTEYDYLKTQKQPWLSHYQLIAEYILTRKANFTVTFSPGEFLNKDLFDNTGSNANRTMSSTLLGMLWPDGGDSFKLKAPRGLVEDKEIKDYYEFAHGRVADELDDSDAGLITALEEYMRDQGAFGTSGLAIFENESKSSNVQSSIIFRAWDVKHMVIGEGPNGYVDRVYYEYELTIENAIKEFGFAAMSDKTKLAATNKRYTDKIKILHAIRPRFITNKQLMGNQNMPWESCYYETDGKHLIKESGYEEMPVLITRFMKNLGEVYGRSAAMEALQDVLELNAIREAEIIATEKILDPPLGVADDSVMGNGTIDTSAGAINVFNISGRIGNSQPVFPLYTVGDLKPIKERIEELKLSIASHFLIDRLLDLANETEMTLGEVKMRDKMRGMTLKTVFGRQIAELFTPMVRRVFNILNKRGELGVIKGSKQEQILISRGVTDIVYIPDAIAKRMMNGQSVYEIEYLSPAARIGQSEQVDGIIRGWQFANEVAAARPNVYDNFDEDISAQIVGPAVGMPRVCLRSPEMIKEIRDARAKAQERAMKLQEAQVMADAAAKAGKASQGFAAAQAGQGTTGVAAGNAGVN